LICTKRRRKNENENEEKKRKEQNLTLSANLLTSMALVMVVTILSCLMSDVTRFLNRLILSGSALPKVTTPTLCFILKKRESSEQFNSKMKYQKASRRRSKILQMQRRKEGEKTLWLDHETKKEQIKVKNKK